MMLFLGFRKVYYFFKGNFEKILSFSYFLNFLKVVLEPQNHPIASVRRICGQTVFKSGFEP